MIFSGMMILAVLLVVYYLATESGKTRPMKTWDEKEPLDAVTQPRAEYSVLSPIERLLLTGEKTHGPYEPVYYQDWGRPVGISSEFWYAPHRKTHVMRCIACRDEYDLDLAGLDPGERKKAAEKFLLTHYSCQSTIPTDNPTQRNHAPGG